MPLLRVSVWIYCTMRDMSATNFMQFIHANTFFSCRFSALMRIDYMKLIKYIGGLFTRYKPCPKNDGMHTLVIRIVDKGRLIRVETYCNQCNFKMVYK